MKRILLTVSDKQMQQLERIAKVLGRTVPEYVTELANLKSEDHEEHDP